MSNELNEAQREALLASADKHEEAVTDIREVVERLLEDGYAVYAKKLREVLVDMTRHVDQARDVARQP